MRASSVRPGNLPMSIFPDVEEPEEEEEGIICTPNQEIIEFTPQEIPGETEPQEEYPGPDTPALSVVEELRRMCPICQEEEDESCVTLHQHRSEGYHHRFHRHCKR